MDPEIAQPTPEVTPDVTPEVTPEYVSKADYDRVVADVATLKESLTTAGQKLSVIDKVAEMLAGKKDSGLSTEEQAVVTELRRLMPHVLPNAKALDSMPQLVETVQAASKAAAQGLVEAAHGYLLELQSDSGMNVGDAKVNFHIGSAVKEWVNQDNSRRERFWRGDRTVIKEGFEEVKAMFSGARRDEKRTVMETVTSRPRNTGPTGSPGAAGSPKTLDFSDKKSVRDAFKAALA